MSASQWVIEDECSLSRLVPSDQRGASLTFSLDMSRVNIPEADRMGTLSHAPTAWGSDSKASKASFESKGENPLTRFGFEFEFEFKPCMASKVEIEGLTATTLPEKTGFSSGPVTCMTPLREEMRG